MKQSFESQPQHKDLDPDVVFQAYLDREKTFDELVLMSDVAQWIQKEEQEVYANIKAEYEELSGLDRRIVDDIFDILKKEELLEESLSHLAKMRETAVDSLAHALDATMTRRSAQLTEVRAQRNNLIQALDYADFQKARDFFHYKQAQDNRLHPFDSHGIGLN